MPEMRASGKGVFCRSTPFPVMYAAGNITGGQLKDIMGGKE